MEILVTIFILLIVLLIGVFIGIVLMCFMKTTKETDLQVILLNIMDQLKKDRAEAEKEKSRYNISKGIFIEADKTIQLIKKLYGGIS